MSEQLELRELEAALEAARQRRLAAESAALSAREEAERIRQHLAHPAGARRWLRRAALLLLPVLVAALAAGTVLGVQRLRRTEPRLAEALARATARQLQADRDQAMASVACRQRLAGPEELLGRCRFVRSGGVAPARPRVATVGGGEAPPSGSARDLTRRAHAAYNLGQAALCLQLAQESLRVDPEHFDAVRVLGLCACSARNRALAKWAHDRINPGPFREVVSEACKRHGLLIE